MANYWCSPEDVPVGPRLSGHGVGNDEVDVVAVGNVALGWYVVVQGPKGAAADSPVWRVRTLVSTTDESSWDRPLRQSCATYAEALHAARELAWRVAILAATDDSQFAASGL